MKKAAPGAGAPTEETLHTPKGTLAYTLTRKRVRNLNLRVRPGGDVAVSAPPRMPKREIEAFLLAKAGWIESAQARMRAAPPPAPPRHTPEECLAMFGKISDEIFPLFADLLGGRPPHLRVREMTSRWGVCHVQKRTITLNTRLADRPVEAMEYVVLHEYVHFLHPNHGEAFHAEMARLMPDYKQRRRLLRG